MPTRTRSGRDAPPAPGLVVGHGAGSRGSRHSQFCLAASERGFAALALDFRGHGDSQGYADGPLEEDIIAAVEFLRAHPAVNPRYICYRGSSMGGFYGLKAAPRADFTAMVLICPAGEAVVLDHLQDFSDLDHPGGEATGAHWDRSRMRAYFERHDSRAMAAQVHRPVFLVHARADEHVPIAHSFLLAAHLRGETLLLALAGGSHASAQHDPTVHATSIEWLREKTIATHSGSTA